MSEKLISRSPDLRRLRDEGYALEVRHGYLILHDIPYVTPERKVALGVLVTNLDLEGERTRRPDSHQVWFAGQFPCHADGTPIIAIAHSSQARTLFDDFTVQHFFSNKPPEGYADYHAKMARYAEIIANEAVAIDLAATPRTFNPIVSPDSTSVFRYEDSASSRADIVALSQKLALPKVGIVGLGGTGGYVLDLVAKTPVQQLHLYDGDRMLQHNAFRAPGAMPLKALDEKPFKVDYWAKIYGEMHGGLVPHALYLDDSNLGLLDDCSFVFLCVDKPGVRHLISKHLIERGVPFVDVGLEVEIIEEEQTLVGACRTTLVTQAKSEHMYRHVATAGGGGDDLYRSNIQVADLNSLNAALAVIKWKKHFGFYQDCYREHQSVYAINAHQLTRDETT